MLSLFELAQQPPPQTPSMFYGITDLTTFVLGTIFIVLLPGPNSLYVMTLSSRRGLVAGYQGAAGIFVGDTILMILSATGAASLLQSTPTLFTVFKLAGAGYLAWLGLGLIKAAWNRWNSTQPSAAEPAPDASKPFQRALLISLLNPKAILFFVSFFIQFVSPDYEHPALSFLLLGVIVQVCSLLYLSALIFGGIRLARAFKQRPRISALSMGAVGLLFVGFGLRLSGASLG